MAPEPDKYMKITLREKGESYYISAIQATDPPETAATKRSRLKRREKRSARLLPALKGFLYCGGNHCYRTEYCRVRGGKLKRVHCKNKILQCTLKNACGPCVFLAYIFTL